MKWKLLLILLLGIPIACLFLYWFSKTSCPPFVGTGNGSLITVNHTFEDILNLSYNSKISIETPSYKNQNRIRLSTGNVTHSYPLPGCPSITTLSPVGIGKHILFLTTNSATPVNFLVAINDYPINLSYFYRWNGSAPVGIAYYGLNILGNSVSNPVIVNTDEIIGTANIKSISAYNAMPPVNVSKHGASLQLNAVLSIISSENITQYYWVQNFVQFYTNNETLDYQDNVWNVTASAANVSNKNLEGSGRINIDNKTNDKYYQYIAGRQEYSLPLNLALITKVNSSNESTIVLFEYKTDNKTVDYDNVKILMPTKSASILISPYVYTPDINVLDTEFVFGGVSSRELTVFNNTNALLSLYIMDNNGVLYSPTPLYSAGSETGEYAKNLTADINVNGILITTGDFVFKKLI